MKPELKPGQFQVIGGKDRAPGVGEILSPSRRDIRELLQKTDEEIFDLESVLMFELSKSGNFRISFGGCWSKTQILGAIELIKNKVITNDDYLTYGD